MTFPVTAPPLNPFDPAATEKYVFDSMDKAFAAIPAGHTHAIFLDGTWSKNGGTGAVVSFLQKAPDGWNIVADGFYDKPNGAGVGIQLAKSW